MPSHEVLQSPGAKPRLFYGYILVVAAFFIMIVVFGVHYAFGVFLKPMSAEFGWTRAMTSGAFSLSWIIQGLLGIVMGGLNDRLGPRIVLTLCGFLLGLGYLLMSQISAVWQLYLFYGVMVGAGLGGVFVPLTSTVAKWFIKRRNMMTGIVVSGMGIGILITPLMVNRLIFAYDWRVSYAILGSIVLVVVIVAAQFLRHDPAQMQLAYNRNKVKELEPISPLEGYSLKEATYTRQFWLVFAMFLSFGFCLYAIMVHIAPHATDLGISTTSAVSILAVIGGVSVIGKVVFGSVADRIGNRQVYVICFILMSASLFWLVTATELWRLYLFAVVFGLAYGGCSTSMSPLVAMLFGIRSHGLIMGMVNNGFTIGATIGAIVAGYIFDVTNSYQLAFFLSGATGALGLILALILRPIKSDTGEN